MVNILARDIAQARVLADKLQLGHHQWRQVRGQEDLMGLDRGSTLLVWGTPEDRPNFRDIMDYARGRQLSVIDLRPFEDDVRFWVQRYTRACIDHERPPGNHVVLVDARMP